MTTTPETPRQNGTSYERLIRHLVAQLRQDAGDYAKVAQGVPMSHELSWDARDVRAWDAATALEALLTRAAGLLGGDPTEEQIERAARAIWERYAGHGPWETLSPERQAPFRKDARVALLAAAAGVAPQEPSLVASAPTVGDDGGHGGDDDRGGREDGPEDEGRSHQATVAGGLTEADFAASAMYRKATSAPSPDREKLISEAIAASDRVNHEELCSCEKPPEACAMYSHRPWSHDPELVANEVLRLAALAAQPVLDESKMAEELMGHEFNALGQCNCGYATPDYGSGNRLRIEEKRHFANVLCEAAKRGELS